MKFNFTGEYCISGKTAKRIADDHKERYKFASKFVKGKVVLDIACGVGYGSNLLKKNAKKVDGVDISKEVIRYAKKSYQKKGITFIRKDIISYRSENLYDVIVCFETIEHIQDDNKALDNLYKLLKTNGLLVISSPNRPITSPKAKKINDKPNNHFHVREYTIGELIDRLKNNGFLVDSKNIYGQRPRFFFNNKFIDNLYEIIFNPDMRSNPVVKKTGFLKTPRYFIITALKQ